MIRQVTSRFLLMILAFSVNVYSNDDLPEEEAYKAQEAALKIQEAFDRQNYDQAKQLAEEALANHSNSSLVLYQAARAQLSDYVPIKEGLGIRYSEKAFRNAESLLKSGLKASDSVGKEYSLLLHIYTANDKLDLASTMIEKFESTDSKDKWFVVNKANFYYVKGDFGNAFSLFSKALEPSMRLGSRPRNAAFSRLTELRTIDAKYERNSLVIKGLAKRVEAAELVNYINAYDEKKPLFLHLTSDDSACIFCFRDISVVEQQMMKFDDNYNHIVTTIEPWTNISLHKDIVKKLMVTGLPHSYVINRGKVLLRHDGQFASAKKAYRFLDYGRYADTKTMDYLYDNLKSQADLKLRGFWFQVFLKYYKEQKGFKSIYMAVDPSGAHTSGFSKEQSTQAMADQEAEAACQKSRIKKRIKANCFSLAKGAKFIKESDSIESATLEIYQKSQFL